MVDLFYYKKTDEVPDKAIDEELEIEGKKEIEEKYED